jgi:predicted lipoprotein with Yx(FWY)xxD motif
MNRSRSPLHAGMPRARWALFGLLPAALIAALLLAGCSPSSASNPAAGLLPTVAAGLPTVEAIVPTAQALVPTAQALLPTAEAALPTAEAAVSTAAAALPGAAAAVGTSAAALPGAAAAGTPAASNAAGEATVMMVQKSNFGRYLTDGKGQTLYIYKPDGPNTSTCYGSCALAWPPLLVTGSPVAGTGITAAQLGTTKRTDGTT